MGGHIKVDGVVPSVSAGGGEERGNYPNFYVTTLVVLHIKEGSHDTHTFCSTFFFLSHA